MDLGIAPHGGVLIDRVVAPAEQAQWLAQTQGAPTVTLGERALSDVEMIATGGLSPLTGFMGEADYRAVVDTLHLANGLPWTIPITLAVTAAVAEGLTPGIWVRLADPQGEVIGAMELQELYRPDREREAQRVYKTTETAHPGVQALLEQGSVYLGGTDLGVAIAHAALSCLPFAASQKPSGVSRAGLADGGGVPDPQSHSSGARIYPEMCVGNRGRVVFASLGGGDQKR